MNNNLLLKYISGSCIRKEEEMVEQRLNESHQNKKAMEELKHIVQVSPGKRIEVDTNQAWRDFSDQHFPQKGPTNKKQESTPRASLRDNNIRSRRIRNRKAVAYSGVAAAVVLLAFVFYYVQEFSTSDVPAKLVNQEITTQKGQRTTVRLSDGTRIHLNAESQLSVAGNYNRGPHRVVYLEGEAFFEVVSDKQRSFEVHTAGAVTRVLGTKFNVTAYPESEQVQVVVAEGKVTLGSAEEAQAPEVQLTQNQKGTVFSGANITASKVLDLGSYLDWSKGRLTFRDASMKEMARRLERWFDIEVTIAKGVTSQNRLLTGSFKDVSLSSVLHSIALSLDMNYEREGRTVIFENE